MTEKKTSFGRQVLGGPRSAKSKHVLVNPKAFTKTCFFTAFLQCRWGCLYSKTLFKSIRLTPTPTLAQHCLIIQFKMSSMFPPAALSALPLSVCLLFRAVAAQQWKRQLFGGGGGRLAAAWWAERRQRSGGNSFPSAWQWRWNCSGGGGGGSSAVVVVAAQWLRRQQAAWRWCLQRGVGSGSAVVLMLTHYSHRQAARTTSSPEIIFNLWLLFC